MIFLNRIYSFGVISVAIMLLMSCGHSSEQSGATTSIQTIHWQLDGNGFVQFLTNDPRYYDYIMVNAYTQTNEALMTTVTATVIKYSGSLCTGYGIVFCVQDNYNFYRLLIDAAGQYSVYSRVGGTWSVIIPWATPSTYLSSGVGVMNEISVTQQSPHNFVVYFNGTQVTAFNDSNFSGGKAGFCAYVGTQADENFPYTPEDIRFKLNSPVVYPP